MSRKLVIPALLAIAVVPLLAQGDDPPSRVARLNFIGGSVSFRPGSVEEWTAATLNYPLTIGDHLWADSDSRVEIHTGSTVIRMADRTAMSILNLDDRTVQLSLTDGTLHIRLRQLNDDESFEVDTPNVAVTLLRAGEYRIDADGETTATSVTVRSGNADVTGGGVAFTVRPRETGRATGMDTVTQDIGPALPTGEFDYWCEARDRHEDEMNVSAQYVPRDMIGYEDLDQNGVWSEVPEYGPVWRPRTVDIDWAPYRDGRWVWVEPWGWTWVDDAPWGFAPFHYGRWAMIGGSWGWIPGRRVIGVRPVYAPALVVFVGSSRSGVAAWFPLGPREVYRPSYHVSDRYVRQINGAQVTNITVINNVYVNQRIPGAITAVSRDTFVSARRIGRAGLIRDDREFARAQVIGTAAPIAPERASVLGRTGRGVAAPPARFVDRQVVARRTPPPPPVSFDAQRQALEANQGRPLAPSEIERYRGGAPRNPRVRVAPAVNGMSQGAPPDRPVVVPRDERGPMRRPGFDAGQPRMEQPPAATPQPDRPQQRRPVFQQEQAPRVEQPPAATPQPDRPQQRRPVFQQEQAPRVEQPPAAPPPPDRPSMRRQVPQQEQPRSEPPVPRSERPTFQRPQRADPPPAAERPAPEQRREAQKEDRRGERRPAEKKDDK